MTVLALVSLGILIYTYVGYPALVYLISKSLKRDWNRSDAFVAKVSIIIPAYNEEKVLERCLNSLLLADFPKDRLEILCGSDGSTDATNQILDRYAAQFPNFHAIIYNRQRGKMLVLNDLVARATGDILLFVDADVVMSGSAIRMHVRNYSDEHVGGVAGRSVIASSRSDGVFRSESIFLNSEHFLRMVESSIHSTVGLYGGNYSMRRSLWRPLPSALVYDDFHSVLTLLKSGRRLVYEPNAISTEHYGRTMKEEIQRKSRNAARCLNTLTYLPETLVHGFNAIELWSHKIFRFFTGLFVIVFVVGSFVGYWSGDRNWWPVLILEAVSAVVLAFGWLLSKTSRSVIGISQLYWFALMNVGFLIGVIKFAFGLKEPIWSQTTRVAVVDPLQVPHDSA